MRVFYHGMHVLSLLHHCPVTAWSMGWPGDVAPTTCCRDNAFAKRGPLAMSCAWTNVAVLYI